MLLAGDEFGRTQGGNNNAYCQDNEISWVNWKIKEKGDSLIRFVQKLTKLRRDFPILRRNRFLTGALDEELDIRDVTWINANGAAMEDGEWADESMRCFGMMIDGRAQATGIKQRGSDVTVLLVLNAHHDVVKFTLPECSLALRLEFIDRHEYSGTRTVSEAFGIGHTYDVTARSLVAFQMAPAEG